jgi:predicted dinucleotide-binding enzyme
VRPPRGEGGDVTDGFAVGVLGSGPVGRGVATLAARAGYRVHLGTRRPAAAKLSELPTSVAVGSFEEAAACEVVFLAVVHRASRELVTRLESALAGKILIDADNAWLPGDREAAGLSVDLTEGRWMSELLPGTRIVRAFSHVDWDLLVPGGMEAPGTYAAPYTADDVGAGVAIEPLVFDMGYVPIRIGDLDDPAIDIGGSLWPGLFTVEEMRQALGGAAGGSPRGDADVP